MARWITNEIMNAILEEVNDPESPVCGDVVVQSHGQPSEVCTEQIAVRFPHANDALLITGFDDVNYEEISTPDHYSVERVELRTQSSDDDGGLQSTDWNVCIMYGAIYYILATRGFRPVANMGNYF